MFLFLLKLTFLKVWICLMLRKFCQRDEYNLLLRLCVVTQTCSPRIQSPWSDSPH